MLKQIYADDPHQTVSGTNALEIEGSREINLESTLQFTSTTGSAYFDFSAYGFVSEDGSNLDQEKKRIADEVDAFAALVTAVTSAYGEFLANAQKALAAIND